MPTTKAPTESDLETLFAVPPERFTAERDALWKRARESRNQMLANRVRSLRKPTRLVWLLNQLARRHPREVDRLFVAAEKLRDAQRQALARRGGALLREASGARFQIIDRLLELGRQILEIQRPIEAKDLADALLAASTRPELATRFRAGHLTEEPEALPLEDALQLPLKLADQPQPKRGRRSPASRTNRKR